MKRYFFHLFNDIEVPDLEGRELASDDEARETAIRECREMMTESVRKGRINLAHRIEVEDIYRRRLFAVRFGDAITIKAVETVGERLVSGD